MPFNVVAFPSQSEERNLFEVQIPAVLSILVTHTLDETVPSALEIQAESKERIKNGISAVLAMEELGRDPNNEQALAQFEAHKADVGYGLLLQKYAPEIEEHTSELQSRFDLVISLLLEIKKH